MGNDVYGDVQQVCDQTLVLILAGGQGSRLFELTASRAKPGLDFGCHYRIIDFPLSNCVNSGLKHIAVATQYKSRDLIHHLVQGWAKYSQEFGHAFELLPASQQYSTDWYLGTADALFQNRAFIRESGAKFVMVLAGDHIYKMDYRPMLQQHANSGAQLSVSCIEVPIAEAAGQFGIMSVDDSDRVTGFVEKPEIPEELDDLPGFALASMGNYVFDVDFLLKQLTRDAEQPSSAHDFGKNIIPGVISQFHVQAYRFRDASSVGAPYWRDVGTLDSYWLAHMALLNSCPDFNLFDKTWPIWCQQPSMPPTQFTAKPNGEIGAISDSLVANGCTVNAATITKSLIFIAVRVEDDALVEECVILPNTTIGQAARLRRVIVDKDCHIPANFEAGFDRELDTANGLRISPNGTVLITQVMLDALHWRRPTCTCPQ